MKPPGIMKPAGDAVGKRKDRHAGKTAKSFYLLMNALKVKKPLAGLTRVPGLKAVSRPSFGPGNSNITYIPVGERLEVPPGVTVPG